jgi:hypothetical protein
MISGARLHRDGHFNVLIKLFQHGHEAINRKSRQLGLSDARKVSR